MTRIPLVLLVPLFILACERPPEPLGSNDAGSGDGGTSDAGSGDGGTSGANARKPNVMLVVDKSGSMHFPIDPSNPSCPLGCGPSPATACPSSCPTRLQEMKVAMGQFLIEKGEIARFGLNVFPDSSQNVCAQGRVVHEIRTNTDDPIALLGAAVTINDTLQQIGQPGGLPASGGTPTATTLRALETNAGLLATDRANLVLLLTDGLPNCNSSLSPTACTCVPGASCMASNLNCLDAVASIDAIASLAGKDIQTIVIGFGADIASSSAGVDTLNAMAVAGGLPRTCALSIDCGASDTCTGGYCGRRFYQAANAAELAAVLERIATIVSAASP